MSSRRNGATKVQFDNVCRCKHCQSTSNNTNSDRSHVALTRLVPCGSRLVCVCQWISITIFEISPIRSTWHKYQKHQFCCRHLCHHINKSTYTHSLEPTEVFRECSFFKTTIKYYRAKKTRAVSIFPQMQLQRLKIFTKFASWKIWLNIHQSLSRSTTAWLSLSWVPFWHTASLRRTTRRTACSCLHTALWASTHR